MRAAVAIRDTQDTRSLDDAWGALDAILPALSLDAQVYDDAFRERIRDIGIQFNRDSDSRDDSTRIVDMLSRDPPELLTITDEMIARDTEFYTIYDPDADGDQNWYLKQLWQRRVDAMKFRGLSKTQLGPWLRRRLPSNPALVERVTDLLTRGQRACMLPSFIPNGGYVNGRPLQNNALYHSHTRVIEHNAAQMFLEGKTILLAAHEVTPRELKRLHFHTLFAVPKPGALARVVTHCSFGSRKTPSYNASVDMAKHSTRYPRPRLPMLRDFADLLCRMKAKFPRCGYLTGAIVDARAAFQQYFLDFDKFLLMWTKLQVRRKDGWLHLLQGNVCGTFGDLGAGDTWDVLASAWTEMQNLVSAMWEALTYVDDMTIIAPPLPSDVPPNPRTFYPHAQPGLVDYNDIAGLQPKPRQDGSYPIFEAVAEARDNLANMLGKESSANDKAKITFAYVKTVGWHFDLRYDFWFVVPLAKKVEKMANYLFCLIPPESTAVEAHNLRSLAGLLCWYSAAIPLGRAFIYALFQGRTIPRSTMIRIDPAMQNDLTMWRALIRIALDNPGILGSPIDLLRSDRVPDFYAVTDACTGVGGGAWIAPTPHWDAFVPPEWLTLRWTPIEKALIEQRLLPFNKLSATDIMVVEDAVEYYKISGPRRLEDETPLTINVLEFATVVFLIMLFAPRLRNSVISLGSDNTATLCWLVRNRSSSGAADCLLKLLSLVCTIYHIRLVVHHVKGVDNHLSDWISRAQGLDNADPHAVFRMADFSTPATLLISLQKGLACAHPPDRRVVCRFLLSSALTSSSTFSTEDLVRLMMLLRTTPDIPKPLEPNIGVVICAFQRLSSAGVSLPKIPQRLDEAVILAKEWNNTPYPATPEADV